MTPNQALALQQDRARVKIYAPPDVLEELHKKLYPEYKPPIKEQFDDWK